MTASNHRVIAHYYAERGRAGEVVVFYMPAKISSGSAVGASCRR